MLSQTTLDYLYTNPRVNLMFDNFQSKVRQFIRLIALCLHIIMNKFGTPYAKLPWLKILMGVFPFNFPPLLLICYRSTLTGYRTYDSIPRSCPQLTSCNAFSQTMQKCRPWHWARGVNGFHASTCITNLNPCA